MSAFFIVFVRFYFKNSNSCILGYNCSWSWDSRPKSSQYSMDRRLCNISRCFYISLSYNNKWLSKITTVYEIEWIEIKKQSGNCIQRWRYDLIASRLFISWWCRQYQRRNGSSCRWFFDRGKLNSFWWKCYDWIN